MEQELTIWNYLKSKGLTDQGVAGLMGNLYAESKLSPINLQDTSNKHLAMTDEDYTKAVDNGSYKNFIRDSAGYGLAQWTDWKRKQNLLYFAQSKKTSVGDLLMQLEFLYLELSQSYPRVLNELKTTRSVLSASNAVLLQFEKPKVQDEAVQDRRFNYSKMFYDKYGTKSGVRIGITTSDLHLREGAGTQYKSLGVMPKGSQVTIISETEGWLRVSSCKLGKLGYCSSAYIK